MIGDPWTALTAAVAALWGFFVGWAVFRYRDPPFFREMERHTPGMPFRVVSTLDGRPVMMNACIGRDIGQTVHEIAHAEAWDRIVVDTLET